MIIKSNTAKQEAPKGKRTIRETVWGNTNAYIGGRFWKTIGPTYGIGVADRAQEFLDGKD